MDVSRAAEVLLAKGWDLIALRPGEKVPRAKAWRESTLTDEDIRDGCNLGVKCGQPSGHLVDIDLDAPEAVRAAAGLLPKTLTHGRPGKPTSHYWYRSEIKQKLSTYKDIDGTMILECRATGAQTMIPPSVHPSGEPLTWGPSQHVLEIPEDDLRLALARVYTVAILAKHWPAQGRHFAAGHVGGFLARLGEPVMAIRPMITLICEIARDDEPEDRIRFACESAERHAKGDRTTGGPSLATAFPDGLAIVNRLCAIYAREGETEVDKLNKTHFVAQLGKGMVVGEEDGEVQFQSFFDFSQRYCNQKVGKTALGDFWLKHPYRRTYRRAVFAPTGSSLKVHENDYNTWRGFAVEPSDYEDGCQRFREHITDVICGGVDAHANFVLDLFADAVQKPGRIMGKALAVRGPQGVGKSVTFESFGKLFGPHFLAVSSRDQIVGGFNAHLSSKVVLFADEAIWGGRREDIGTLKSLVTQERIVIQRKGIDRVSELNCLRLLMATNEDWVWPVGNQERRGVILDVTIQKPPSYFDALWAEVQSPSFAPALLGMLQRREVDYPALRRGFATPALLEQHEYTSDVTQQWWKTVLDLGSLGGEIKWPEAPSLASLYDTFVSEMGTGRGAGIVHRGTPGLFTKRLMKLLPNDTRIETRSVAVNIATHGAPNWQKKEARVIVLPTLAACRAEYNRVTGMEHEWLVGEVPEQQEISYDEAL